MPSLATSAQDYLYETRGVPKSGYQAWTGLDRLPYFLRDAFDFQEMDILGHTVVLARDRTSDRSSIGDIRVWLDKVQSVAGLPAVYVTDALASCERKRLIEQKVPFIVPGNQLYLPELPIDLREYYRKRPGPADALLSPSAQAMLKSAVRKLAATGLARLQKVGRCQCLSMSFSPEETWKRANTRPRSPVQRTVWTSTQLQAAPPMRLAGRGALARCSMLAEPGLPVYAVSRVAWRSLKSTVVDLPEAMQGAYEWQLWNYTPTLQADRDTVDPLSLMLSLRASTDERIQSALDTLKEQLPW